MNLPPLPVETVRDLLGIVRALYRAWAAEPARAEQRVELEAIGKELRLAIDLARRGGPGSLGNSASVARAERACVALGKLIGEEERLLPLVLGVGERVGRRR